MDTDLLIHLPSGIVPVRRKWRLWAGWAILLAYLLLLAWRRWGAPEEAAPVPLWELRDLHWIVASVRGLVFGALREFAFFAPVGLAAVVLVPAGSPPRRGRPARLRGLAAGILLMSFACAPGLVRSWCLAEAAGWTFPLLGCLLGAWAGATWLRGWRARLWFGPKVALLSVLGVCGAVLVASLSLEDAPLPFESARLNPGEKQRLRRLIPVEGSVPAGEDGTCTVRLTEHDANVLLSWCLSSESQARKAAVRLGDDSVELLMSLSLGAGGRARYLNLRALGSLGIEAGVLRLHMNRCRIGSAECPRPLLRMLSPLAASMLNHDRRTQPFLNAAQKMIVEPNLIRVAYRPTDLPGGNPGKPVRSALVSEELLAATRVHVDHLLLLAGGPLPDWQPSFNLCLKTAFMLARDRSAQGDAVTENQAAILALGILLGDARIDDVLGAADHAEEAEVRQVLAQVVLHGRSDWTRHFCVSAAIAVLSNESASDVCGLLKEELDADAGGSGFSFADLLVSRAGAVFAVRATRSAETARAMQDRLRRGFYLEELCPAAADLPEGLSEADLQSRYGGVGGAGYRRLVEEIERRVAACAAYR